MPKPRTRIKKAVRTRAERIPRFSLLQCIFASRKFTKMCIRDRILSKLTKKMYGEVKIKAEESPDSFLDKTYLDQLSRELEKKYSYIVVRQDNEIIYSSNEQKTDLIEDSLPLFGEYDPNLDGGIYIGGDIQELVKQYDFYFSDHSEGSIFIITNMSILIPQVKKMCIRDSLGILAAAIMTDDTVTIDNLPDVKDINVPVSYTHLDVYKRQSLSAKVQVGERYINVSDIIAAHKSPAISGSISTPFSLYI